ncbi:MAG: hypothetical protein AAGJ95_16715, partial [Cyanobacteria bacterium J06554_11]
DYIEALEKSEIRAAETGSLVVHAFDRPGDVIGVRGKDASKKLVEANLEFPGLANIPTHLDFDKGKLEAKVNGIIDREWVALNVNELLVVEYYSRQA